MKRVLLVVFLLVAAAVLGLWRSHGGVRAGLNRVVNVANDEKSAGVASDEIRKTFNLKPGDHVEVAGINGFVEVQTSDSSTAEVFVRRTGDNPNSLQRRELTIEQTSTGFMVRSRQKFNGFWDHLFGKDPREEVTIKAPRQIALSIRGVNGRVTSGDVDGSLEVKGINGRVEVGAVSDSAQISGVNGAISVGLRHLDSKGARFNGINGPIELKLSSGLNADLTAKGMNGNVRSEIPEVTVNRETQWSRFSARIGDGGAPIELGGINGNVKLTKLDREATASAPSTNPPEKPAEKKGSQTQNSSKLAQ
jgi:hypothetical protein